MKTNRREFLKNGTLAAGAIATFNPKNLLMLKEKKMVDSIGFQSWTIRKKLNEDFPGTLKMMADFGYDAIEMCSPLSYAMTGFAPLHKLTGKELRMIIEDHGMICRSSHYNIGELRDNLEERMDWSHQVGINQMMLASFWLPKGADGVEDYKRAANELNEIGRKTKEQGLQMGFHNHHLEFEKRDNKLIYDVILEELDPEIVKMQFQVAVVNIGYHAAEYFRKHPRRFISAHLADWDKELDKQVPIGQGEVDWKDFFEAAKIGGIENVFVEMDPETFEESAEFLSKL